MVASVLLAATLTGCGLRIPTDPEGTLDLIRARQTLRVGISHHPPRITATPPAPPTGPEIDLVHRYADHLGARITWTVDTEAALVEGLHHGRIDLVAAGLDTTSPWATEIGMTRAYQQEQTPDGTTRRYVMAVPAGENALLSDLERWLDQAVQENR
ncbi:hypothetical protein AUCHE_17_00920 [Austwickia chelonae NBRC 105200]|uniref:Solute-binding protein family 3/N-terminal domain-containing protein n=1 Tax=Austwickia chelonae NBRC 105200 TaxID=1184607 RepID=K6VU59_9MICO|nr:hypothetical protein AUCHE_17_00920 [Austwickia chelonae NBRC 105200]